MSSTLQVKAPKPIRPIYWTAKVHKPILLYAGPLRHIRSGEISELDGLIEYRWLPTPRLAWEGWSSEADSGLKGLMAVLGPGGVEHVDVPDLDISVVTKRPTKRPRPEGKPNWYTSGTSNVTGEVGDRTNRAHSVIFNVLNFSSLDGEMLHSRRRFWRGRVVLEAYPFRVTLDSRRDLDDVRRELQSSGGFAFTHVGRLERTDGKGFSVRTLEGQLKALHSFLTFCRGFRVSPELPVALDQGGDPVWARWKSGASDPYRGAISWCDTHNARAAEMLFPLFMDNDVRQWRDVLQLAVNYYAQGNRLDPVNPAVLNSQAGLELLSWHYLTQKRHIIKAGDFDGIRASRKLDRLFAELSIPNVIPVGLSSLKRLAKTKRMNATEIACWVRNKVAHPNRKSTSISTRALIDVAFLSTWWLELTILALLGYEGQYRNRSALFRRSGPSIEKVPWA